jgi:hypothetical protein
LGLGFFKDVKLPIYNGNFEIVFRRNHNDNILYRYGNVVPNEGKVEIKEMSNLCN